MRNIESYVSPFIESQFPEFYKTEGANFILFVKTYYEWLESSGQLTQVTRELFDYRDIDRTIDDFVSHFKNKYLIDLPFDTSISKRTLVKHIQDLYRTKGTERGIELLFRLLYNVQSSVYYPGDDVLKPSSGEWKVPEYIEVSPSDFNYNLVNKTITGTTSGAVAFVERIVKKRIQGKFIDVLFISGRIGDFAYNERVVIQSNPHIQGAPKIIGSLDTLTVTNGGEEYNVGDVLSIVGGTGQQGKALVTGVSTQTGRVNFKIEDGGYGYTANAITMVSQRNIAIANVTNSNTSITGFEQFETIIQPLRTVEYTATNAYAFANGTVIENYYGNGAVSANALVIYSEPVTTTNGYMIIVPHTGSVNSDATFSLRGNTATAVIDNFTDSSATGNAMFVSNTSLGIIHMTNAFVGYPGSYVYGATSNTYADVLSRSSGTSATFSVGRLKNTETVLLFSDLLRANNTGNVAFMDITLDGSNSNVVSGGYGFPKYADGDKDTTLQDLLRYGTKTIGEIDVLSRINPGEGYNVDPYVFVLEPEVASLEKHDVSLKITPPFGLFITNEIVEMSANSIGTQLTVSGFNGTAANGTSTATAEIGEYVWQSNGSANVASGFVSQVNVSGGSGTIRLTGVTGTFTNAYGISTLTTNATASVSDASLVTIVSSTIGKVKDANTSVVNVRRLSFNNEFYAGYTLFGRSSGASATITDAADDYTTPAVGADAVVSANVQVANTVVSTLQVIDSGYGYVDDETVSLQSPTNDYVVSAKVQLNKQGFSEGFYQTERGFLNGSSKIYDGDYFQDYSYEIQSRIPLQKYASVLKDILHVSGTKMFGKVVFDSYADKQFDSIIPQSGRVVDLVYDQASGTIAVGDTVTQNTAEGIITRLGGMITIVGEIPYIEKDTIALNAYGSVRVLNISTNSSYTVLYTEPVAGKSIDTGDTFSAVIGRDINIHEVHQGDSGTGSFVVGETLRQYDAISNTVVSAHGVVQFANSTNVTIRYANGTFDDSKLVWGATSNAYASVVSISDATDDYTAFDSINTAYLSNIVGGFVADQFTYGTSHTATATYINVTLDT